MASTYTPIATTTLGSAAASYTFSSIPSTYTDLVLVITGGNSTLSALRMQLNSDTGTNYSYTRLYGNGTTASSDRFTTSDFIDIGYLPNDANNNSIIHLMNYSNTTTYKSVLNRWNTTTYTTAEVGLWRSTSAINSIKLYNLSYNINAGSTFTLYGIKAA